MYRRYENPWELEKQLADAQERLRKDPCNEDLAFEVAELKERVNFAWQDDEEDYA